jgi:hypothetical protein
MTDAFRRAALSWAAGGRGKPLVDAAANALAEGFDSPSLRMLAGATAVAADEEADEWAARTFAELGLDIHARFSSKAIVAFARLRAREFLRSRGTINEESPRALAAEFYGYSVASQYADELDTWGVIDDYFVMLEEGVIYGSDADVMPSLIAELEKLSRSTSGFEATPSELLGDEAWRGGYYELVLVLGEVSDWDADIRLDRALQACWEHPSVTGPFETKLLESASVNTELDSPCFGWIQLPSGRTVMATHVIREAFGLPKNDLLVIGFPMGGLINIYPSVGAYPFGDEEKGVLWRPEVDVVLVSIARSIDARSRFLRGAIGHEVSELLIEDHVPDDRPFAYVSSSESGVVFHPPTRG